MIRNCDLLIHADWYCDGAESGEQLWRLDFCTDDHSFQAQLFAKLDPEQWLAIDLARIDVPVEDEKYVSFRLFLERDNRDTSGEQRIDYACASWPITEERAQQLLGTPECAIVPLLETEISHVAGLPCDKSLCEVQ